LNPETGKGVSGSKIIFAHPGDLSGVLMELVEKKK
jgi:hypothetical protein